MSYPLVLSGETVSVFEVPNAAEDPRVVECMEAHLTHKFGGLALTESIDQYREVITPGSGAYLYEGSNSPIDPVCYAAVEGSEDGRDGRVLAVSTFGKANDPAIERPEVASFTATAASRAGAESSAPKVGWVETVAWEPTMGLERSKKVVPFLLRTVSDRLAQDGFITVGYAAQATQAGVISDRASRMGLDVGLLQTPKPPIGWIADGLRHPDARVHAQRILFMLDVDATRRTLADVQA